MVDKTRVFHQAPSPCVVHFLKLVFLAATNSLIGDLVSEWACKNCKWRPKTSFSCRKIKFFFYNQAQKNIVISIPCHTCEHKNVLWNPWNELVAILGK